MHMPAIGGDGLSDGARMDRVSSSNFDQSPGRPSHVERHGVGRHDLSPGAAASPDRPAVAVMARTVTGFLEEHPALAQMPLGMVAEQLTVAGGQMEDGGAVDPETTKLASRIEKFISNHSRLAHSEFGSAILNLAQTLQNSDAAVDSDKIMDRESLSG